MKKRAPFGPLVRSAARRKVLGITAASCALVTLAACGSSSGGGSSDSASFGSRGIRFVVASDAGGGFDRASRQIQPGMEKRLDTKLNMEYQGGAGGAVAMQLLRRVKDCSMVVSSADPKVLLGQYVQKADYDYQRDFVSVGGFTRDYPVLMVKPGSQYDTIQKLIDYARSHPKKITVGVGTLASDGKAVVDLEKAAGVDFNIVPLGGGSEANNALLGGKVPVAESSVFNSVSLTGKIKVISVLGKTNPIPDQTDNAPTADAALNVKLPQEVNNYGLFVNKACKTGHPAQYKALVSALEGSLTDSSFKSTVQKLDQTGWYVFTSPADFDKEIIAGGPGLRQYVKEQHITGES